jgi:ubiquitin C-terminal hydrolase
MNNKIIPVYDFFENFKSKILNFEETGEKKILINYKKDIGIKLKNEGNTCYANSSMQLLLHCRYLTEYIYKLKEYKSPFINYYYKLIEKFLSGGERSTIYNLLLIMSKINPIFLDGRQHDPIEFIYFFLSLLNKELMNNNKFLKFDFEINNKFENYKKNFFMKNNTIISLFIGFYKITIANKYESYSPFKSLDIPLENENGNIIENIYDSIKYFTMRGNSIYTIEELPDYLFINLKRVKNVKHLSHDFHYSEKINLRQFLPKEYKKSTNYQLIGVLKHHGSGKGGHKTAVCKHLNLNIWRVFNDDISISNADEYDIFKGEANILLYEIIKDNNY